MKVLVLNGSPKGEKAILSTLQKHFLTAFQLIRKLNISRLKRKQSSRVWVAFRVGAEHPANVL